MTVEYKKVKDGCPGDLE